MNNTFWKVAPWLFIVMWAGGYSFAKLGLPYMEPLSMLTARFGIAMLLLWPVVWLLKAELPADKAHWLSIITTGFLIQSLYFGLAYLAMKRGMSAGMAALILSMQPILVACLSAALTGDRVSKMLWLGLILGFAGALVVIFSGHELSAVPMSALLLTLIALLAMTFATLFEKRFGRQTHPMTNTAIQYSTGFFTLLPVALLVETQTVIWHIDLLIAMFYLVFINSIIAISLFMGMLRRKSATQVSALFYLVPPLAAVIAWLLLGETLNPLALLGFAVSVLGIYLVNHASAKGQASNPEPEQQN